MLSLINLRYIAKWPHGLLNDLLNLYLFHLLPPICSLFHWFHMISLISHPLSFDLPALNTYYGIRFVRWKSDMDFYLKSGYK